MSKIKNISRRGTMILVASIVAIVLVPTAVLAASVTVKGSPSGLKADVDNQNSLRVAIEPALNQTGQINPTSSWSVVVPANTVTGNVVKSLNVDTWFVNPGINSAIQFAYSADDCASVVRVFEAVNPGGIGESSIDLGLGGYDLQASSLCVINNDPTNLHAAVFATYSAGS